MNFLKCTLFFQLLWLICSTAGYAAPTITLRTEIRGISGAPLTNIQNRFVIIQESDNKNLSEKNIQDFFKVAPGEIRKALQPFGYFQSDVHAELTHQATTWTAHFTINPGPVLRITHLDLQITGEGRDNAALQDSVNTFSVSQGEPFQTEVYEKAKQTILQTANNQGYIKAAYTTKEVRINLQAYTASIILRLNTGPRYYFGPITFSPNPLADEFLSRYAPFKEGDPFSSQQLLKFQQNLNGSHYFQQVIVNPEIAGTTDHTTPIAVKLTPYKSEQYKVGLGYGTFTGPRLTLGTDWRYITANGQHFSTQIKLSSVLSGLAAVYTIPGKNPLVDQYTLGANMQKFTPTNGRSLSKTFSVNHIKTLDEWQRTLSLRYLTEESQNYTVNQSTQNNSLVIPSLSISRIKADNLMYPRFGSKVSLMIQGAHQKIISTASFIQTEIRGKYITSPTPESRVILRGDLGYTAVGLAGFPLSLSFFAGGIDSIRGFPYSTVGPGRYLKVASAEYQHHVVGNWSGAVFYDVGTANDHITGALNRGAGVGVIYVSFIGPIELYVARAISKPGKPFRIEFSIGPDF